MGGTGCSPISSHLPTHFIEKESEAQRGELLPQVTELKGSNSYLPLCSPEEGVTALSRPLLSHPSVPGGSVTAAAGSECCSHPIPQQEPIHPPACGPVPGGDSEDCCGWA